MERLFTQPLYPFVTSAILLIPNPVEATLTCNLEGRYTPTPTLKQSQEQKLEHITLVWIPLSVPSWLFRSKFAQLHLNAVRQILDHSIRVFNMLSLSYQYRRAPYGLSSNLNFNWRPFTYLGNNLI
jgi:hypothetical protein